MNEKTCTELAAELAGLGIQVKRERNETPHKYYRRLLRAHPKAGANLAAMYDGVVMAKAHYADARATGQKPAKAPAKDIKPRTPAEAQEAIVTGTRNTPAPRVVRPYVPTPTHAAIGGTDLRAFSKYGEPAAVPENGESPTPHVDTYQSIACPRLRTAYWNEHAKAIRTELMAAAAAKNHMDGIRAEQERELHNKRAAIEAKKQAAARAAADKRVKELAATLKNASPAKRAELEAVIASAKGVL